MQHRKTEWIQLPQNGTLNDYLTSSSLRRAAEYLKKGELVAFPTETVYGLGADGTSEEAVAKIFQAKGRPADNPLIIHLADRKQLHQWVASIPPVADQLIRFFWPGPLTIVIKHNGQFAPQVTAGLPTVALRVPAHPIARALIQMSGLPIAAPSANRSGKPSPTKAEHVWQDLQGNVACVIDGGSTEVGLESTVIDLSGEQPLLLRPGGLAKEEIERVIGPIQMDPAMLKASEQPRSPGMKYRHYAPDGELWLYQGDPLRMVETIQRKADEWRERGKKVGILTTTEHQQQYLADLVIACGTRKKPETVARNLFQTFHQFNAAQVQLILAESFPEQGLYYSVMNRLKKAATKRFGDC